MREYTDEMLRHARTRAEGAEVFAERLDSFSIMAEDSQLKYCTAGTGQSFNVRLVDGGRQGLAQTEDPQDLRKIVARAADQLQYNTQDGHFARCTLPQSYPRMKDVFDDTLAHPDTKALLDTMSSFIDFASGKGVVISEGGLSAECVHRAMENKAGMRCSSEYTNFSFLATLKYKDSKYSTIYSLLSPLNEFDLVKESERFFELLECTKKKVTAKKGKCRAVIAPQDVGELINLFMPSLCADNIQRGKSQLSGKIGEKMFSEKLTIYDGPEDKALNAFPADMEGTALKEKVLVDNGVLKGYLYDNYTSDVDSCMSTGNCTNFGIKPSVGPSNLWLGLGKRSTEQMISSMDDGIYASDLFGYHGANVVTGDFSVAGTYVFKIEKGEIVGIVPNCMISGNVFELLKGIEEVSKDSRLVEFGRMPSVMASVNLVSG